MTSECALPANCCSLHSSQSSPNNSLGCGERSLAQAMAWVAHNWSQPQQMRSGCAGWIGNLIDMAA
ncbi:MAG: hypothetical protein AUJ20_10370 [Comamonadaceae bacterium CG1_02_60_18]|nr:MAG: hypothetical protein AUJ20_10370 [Comamonadaceae bacterium CG1_02_60_18]